jgi:hypothetical protein
MSEPLSERLSQFTPDGSTLDRDALLFAAGRASARPNRGWMVAVGALTACQMITLVLLLPGTKISFERSSPSALAHQVVQPEAASSPDASELGVLTRQLIDAKDNDVPSFAYVVNLAPNDPSLTNLAGSTLAEMK